MTRRFTGGHMLALMLAFFGTVVAVNFVMATLAVRTFGGTVVDNSYVASQRYNHWLDQARAQRALGWTADLSLDPDRHVAAAIVARGRPLDEILARLGQPVIVKGSLAQLLFHDFSWE